MGVFDASPVRRGLDVLLATHPHLDLLGAFMPGDDEDTRTHWLLVELGQPSEGETQSWARWRFAIFLETGAVHRFEPDSSVADDPFIVPSPVASYNAEVLRVARFECRIETLRELADTASKTGPLDEAALLYLARECELATTPVDEVT